LQEERRKGLLALVFVVLMWSGPPIVIRYLSGKFNPFSLNFYRYLPATLFFVAYTTARGQRVLPAKGEAIPFLLLAIPKVIFQTAFVLSFYYLMPTQSVLVNKVSVVFAALISVAFFPDERSEVLSRRFLAGGALALAGVAGFVLAGADAEWRISRSTAFGYACALTTAMAWATYTAIAKKVVRRHDPAIMFARMGVVNCVALAVIMFLFGEPGDFLAVGTFEKLLVFFSGLFFVGVANVIYYSAVARLGAAVSVTFTLLIPLSVGVLSRILFGETLSAAQTAFGAAILVGAGMTAWRGKGHSEGGQPGARLGEGSPTTIRHSS